MGYVYHPPRTWQKDFQLVNDATDYTFTFLVSQLVAEDFNAPGIHWSPSAALSWLLNFAAIIQKGGWIWQLTDSTIHQNFLGLISPMALIHVHKPIENRFHGCHHLPIGCAFVVPFQGSIQSPITGPYSVET